MFHICYLWCAITQFWSKETRCLMYGTVGSRNTVSNHTHALWNFHSKVSVRLFLGNAAKDYRQTYIQRRALPTRRLPLASTRNTATCLAQLRNTIWTNGITKWKGLPYFQLLLDMPDDVYKMQMLLIMSQCTANCNLVELQLGIYYSPSGLFNILHVCHDETVNV